MGPSDMPGREVAWCWESDTVRACDAPSGYFANCSRGQIDLPARVTKLLNWIAAMKKGSCGAMLCIPLERMIRVSS